MMVRVASDAWARALSCAAWAILAACDGGLPRPSGGSSIEEGPPSTAPTVPAPPGVADAAVAVDAEPSPSDADLPEVVHGGGGPVVGVPDASAPLTFCRVPSITLGGGLLRPGSGTSAPFADAWNAAVRGRGGRGGVMLRLDGLTSDPPQVTLTLGTPAARGAGFDQDASAPATHVASVDAVARQVSVEAASTTVALHFDDAEGAYELPVGAFSFQATLDSNCARLEQASLLLIVPTSEGQRTFRGQTLAELFGPGGTEHAIGSAPAWGLVLTGRADPSP